MGAVRGTLRLNATRPSPSSTSHARSPRSSSSTPRWRSTCRPTTGWWTWWRAGSTWCPHRPAPHHSSLVARRLATDRLVVCAFPAYLARAGTPREPSDLHQQGLSPTTRWCRASAESDLAGRANGGGVHPRAAVLQDGRQPPGSGAGRSRTGRRSLPSWSLRTWRPGGYSGWCSRAHGGRSSASPRSPLTARRPLPVSVAPLDFLVAHFRTHGPRPIPLLQV